MIKFILNYLNNLENKNKNKNMYNNLGYYLNEQIEKWQKQIIISTLTCAVYKKAPICKIWYS